MLLEVIKEPVIISKFINKFSVQPIIENDIIVPDSKFDISSIQILDGDILINNIDILQNKIILKGNIVIKIIYAADNESDLINGINSVFDFSYTVDVENVKKGMTCNINSDIEHINFEIINSRKIKVKAIINLNGKIINNEEYEIITDLKGLDDISILKNKAQINCNILNRSLNFEVKEIFVISNNKPSIKEILRNDFKILKKDFIITDNKLMIKAELNVNTLYLAEDERHSIQNICNVLPFSQVIDFDFNEDIDLNLKYDVINYKIDKEEDSDGEFRNIKNEFLINILLEAYTNKEFNIIEDAYSKKTNLLFEKETINSFYTMNKSKIELNLKDNVLLNEIQILEILNVFCKPILYNMKLFENKIVIEGNANVKILYLSDNQVCNPDLLEHEMPFKHSVEVENINIESECEILFEVLQTNAILNTQNEIEIDVQLILFVKAMNNFLITNTSKIIETSFEIKNNKDMPSFIIYYTKQGDTLWKIAKKYFTSIDELKKLNNLIDCDNIELGKQIIINNS